VVIEGEYTLSITPRRHDLMSQSQGEDDYWFEAVIGEASHPVEKQQSLIDDHFQRDPRK
jgi:hypothetical protein